MECRVVEEEEMSVLARVKFSVQYTFLVEYARVNSVEVLTAMLVRIPVSWDMTPCILVYSF